MQIYILFLIYLKSNAEFQEIEIIENHVSDFEASGEIDGSGFQASSEASGMFKIIKQLLRKLNLSIIYNSKINYKAFIINFLNNKGKS